MLDRKTFFIREHVGFMKLSDTYDILDPLNGMQVGVAKEKPGGLVTVLRLLINKRLMPTRISVYRGSDPANESQALFSLHRGFNFFVPKVTVHDARGVLLGWLKSRMFTFRLGVTLFVFDAGGNQVATLKGDWKGWNFRFLDRSGQEVGTITKKWAGIGKELFTSADNYMVALKDGTDSTQATLLLAAGLSVDMLFKEN